MVIGKVSTTVLVIIVFDLLLMICFGLLIGINRRIPIRYNLIEEGKDEITTISKRRDHKRSLFGPAKVDI
ncbi:MAG: hypothetical protein M3P08_04745 [Thermoproteota archaeon]|nr:hypothetical protein [Thermoproteota archaeon]